MAQDADLPAAARSPLDPDPSATTAALRAVALTLAAFFIGLGVHVRDGEYMSPSGPWYPAIWCVGAALVAAVVAVRPPRRIRFANPAHAGELALAVLMLAVVAQFALLLRGPPSGWNPWSNDLKDDSVANLRLYYGGVTAAAGLTIAMLACRRWYWVFPFAGVLGIHLFLGCWTVRSCPRPDIDVWHFQQIGGRALLAGHNPYTAKYPDIYGSRTNDPPPATEPTTEPQPASQQAVPASQPVSGTQPAASQPASKRAVYGHHLTTGQTLKFGFPYPPVSLMLSTLGLEVGGDHRYAQAVAMTASGLLIAAARPGRWGALAALLLLFTPRAFFIVGRGWTEPLVVLLFALTLFCAGRFPKLLPFALGLFLASKQYLLFAIPLAWMLAPDPRDARQAARFVGGALLVALLVTAPLALWAPKAYVVSTLVAQLDAPFRQDSLSWLVWFYDRTGVQLGAWVAFLLAVGVLCACLRYGPRKPAGFAIAMFAVYLPFIAFNKQAFANYYLFVIGTAVGALGMLRPEHRTEPPRTVPTRQRTPSGTPTVS